MGVSVGVLVALAALLVGFFGALVWLHDSL
jgi:hypothetical protein